MGIIRKILLLDLPPSLEKALGEQLSAQQNETELVSDSTIPEGEVFDLILHKSEKTAGFPPAIPLLPLNLARQERLGTLLRQMAQMTEEPSLWLEDFNLGAYTCKPSEKTLVSGEKETSLTDKETDILVFLAKHNGAAVGRDALLKNVWRYHEDADTHTLETHIYRLRQKIEEKAEEPRLLLTDGQGGYRLNFGHKDTSNP